MIRLFRHSRKILFSDGRLTKYLGYAIGEIILVVLGIIIALQLNIWNENRKDYNQVETYARALVDDLRSDIEMIKLNKHIAEQMSLRIDSLTDYVRGKEIEEISNITVLNYTWIHKYRPYSWKRATIEELKSSGSLSLIQNKDLVSMITEYDALTKHMDEDYFTDKAQGESAMNLLLKVINTNYPNLEELSEVLRVATVFGELSDVLDSPVYKEAESLQLDLISDDINNLHEAINSYTRLRFNLNIRTGNELPELLADAQDLIDLLEAEY